MNNRTLFKYLAGLIMGAAIFLLFFSNGKRDDVLRVSMYWNKSAAALDPAKIAYAPEAIILDNLYGNIVTYDESGNLVVDLADDVFWDGSSYIFSFSGEKKSSTGKSITATDAAISLKRLIILNQNTHGKLKNYLCDTDIKSLNDSCKGIIVEGKRLKLTPSSSIAHDLLLSLLTGIDYKIVPQEAISQVFPFEIQDYSTTSGAYFLESAPTNESLKFSANLNYHEYSKSMPQKWEIVSGPLIEDVSKLGITFDMITTGSYIDWSGENKVNFTKFATYPISSELLVFAQHAQTQLSLPERAFIVEKIRSFLSDKMEHYKSPTYQFFPVDSVACLSSTEEAEIANLFLKTIPPNRLVRVGFPKSVLKNLGDTSTLLKENIEIVPFEIQDIKKRNREADAMFVSTDSAFQEDISLLEYNFSFGIFGTQEEDSDEWLAKYVKMGKAERITTLRSLHFETLRNIRIGPLYSMPYFAASTADWKIEMSKIHASTHIWKMKKKSSIF